jgi:hypothetical protein
MTCDTKIDTISDPGFDALINVILQRSDDAYGGLFRGTATTPPVQYSDRARRFGKLLDDADLGCKDTAIRTLIAEMAGEDLPRARMAHEKTHLDLTPWTALVDTQTPETWMIIMGIDDEYDGWQVFTQSGDVDMEEGQVCMVEECRPATRDEIKAVVEANRAYLEPHVATMVQFAAQIGFVGATGAAT